MADYQTIEQIQATIREVLERAGIQARVEYEDSLVSGLVFNIFTRDAKLLIGHQGGTLHSLEHIIHAIIAKQQSSLPLEQRVFFSIDVDDYKRNRQYHLKQMIKELVSDMKRSGKPTTLPPMPKYERKFAHMYIQEQFPHVTTESIGVDPNRYIKLSL
jgi:spoIIIJ-associated protein